jgi:hypothetical protein
LRYRRTRGPFCKMSRSAELTGTLTTVQSDLDRRMRIEQPRTATCGRRKTSGDGHAGERRRTAADLAGEDRNRSAVHDLACGFHRDEARGTEKRARGRGRLGCSGGGAQHGGAEQYCSATTASPSRRLRARVRRQAAPVTSSPCDGAPGQLHDGG